jgi:Domain of unknown function (DUF3387)
VQARSFAEMLDQTIRRYQNRAIEAAQVIEELIQLAKEMREANERGEKLGPTRQAAIGPNKPDRFRAEFLLFGLILAHLLIKPPLQPRFLSRNEARKRSVLCILKNGEDGCERSQDFDERFN